MTDLQAEFQRLQEDFQHGGKLGPKSTARLIYLIGEIVNQLAKKESA